ncbi:hypothetical protein LTR64_000410 [Lithohypha guttulata]|uniref:uncharacterized protein n=1 Tax=Lithohypha guttulata TaxID=1690604 RepID=UPI002DDE4CCB|nr:hypothetical protein LTR51_005824 [Lithohypha guttulata]
MVYTKERLEHALRVFHEIAPYGNERGFPSDNLERHLRSRYGFRRAAKIVPLPNFSTWHEHSKEGSDDGEYDPKQEKKKSCNRKKKNDPKRKAEDVGDEEKQVKKTKDEEKASLEPYITFRLMTENGRRFLADLGPIRGRGQGDFEDEELEREPHPEPSYFNRYPSTRKSRKNSDAYGTTELAREWGVESEISKVGGALARTSLRSGRILKKKKSEERKEQDVEDYNPDNDRDPVVTKDLDKDHVSQAQPSPTTSTVTKPDVTKPIPARQIGSWDDPIELLDDSDEEGPHLPNSHATLHHHNKNNATRQQYPPSPVSLRSDSVSLSQASRSHDEFYSEASTFTIETYYAHPIHFRLIPKARTQCDFCADYRMGILGLGKRAVSVFVDKDKPFQYQELGDGHCNEGKSPTKMCVTCALRRLWITRCHDPSASSYNSNSRARSNTKPAFRRVQGLMPTKERLAAYLRHLFKKELLPGTNTLSKTALLPTCNLCFTPAMWECCKWQKTDIMKRPCRIPDQTDSSAVVRALSGTPSTPPRKMDADVKPIFEEKPTTSVDKDDDVDMAPNALPSSSSSITNSLKSQNLPSSNSSSKPPHPHSSTTTLSSPSYLRAPISGCGLKLCLTCKSFLETRCNGQLDRSKVMKWLRAGPEHGNKFGPRADVEWLFGGSMLERCYEMGVGECGKGGRRG